MISIRRAHLARRIDFEAVVLGPDGLSLFDDLRRREAAHSAMLYAFDLIEHGVAPARYCGGNPAQRARCRRRPYRVRARLPAWCRRHRFKTGGVAVQRERSENWNR